MALILCIETGTDICSVALARDGRLLALHEGAAQRDHARSLAPFVDRALCGAGVAPGELDAVAVSKGPGSYTGLRIGVSFAKGMCYALGIPLIGVGSLLSLAAVAREQILEDTDAENGRLVSHGLTATSRDRPSLRSPQSAATEATPLDNTLLCPMIDARRMEVYAGVFDWRLDPLSPVEAHIIDAGSFSQFRLAAGGEFLIFGDGAAKCAEALAPRARYIEVKPSARGLIAAAHAAFDAGTFEDTAYFEPFYLKDFVVTTTRKKLW